jgi:hypothetical protein
LGRERGRATGFFAGVDFVDRDFGATTGFFDKKWSEK